MTELFIVCASGKERKLLKTSIPEQDWNISHVICFKGEAEFQFQVPWKWLAQRRMKYMKYWQKNLPKY